MNHLNSILLEGNVVAEPQVRATASNGRKLVVFRIASNRYTRLNPGEDEARWATETLYMDVLAWGNLGDACVAMLAKGLCVRVVGRLKSSSFKCKDGAERQSCSIVAQHVEFKLPKGTGHDEKEVSINAGEDDGEVHEPVVIYEY